MTAVAETPARKLASRHYCPAADKTGHSSFHTAGNGKPRGMGRYCGTDLTTVTGLWGVFVWASDGRYWLDGALTTHLSEPAAERARDKAYESARVRYGYGSPECSVVVRWIHLDA